MILASALKICKEQNKHPSVRCTHSQIGIYANDVASNKTLISKFQHSKSRKSMEKSCHRFLSKRAGVVLWRKPLVHRWVSALFDYRADWWLVECQSRVKCFLFCFKCNKVRIWLQFIILHLDAWRGNTVYVERSEVSRSICDINVLMLLP